MKNRTILAVSPLLFCAVLFVFISQVCANPGEPASKEIIGTHSGGEAKERVPFNMALVKAGKVQMGISAEEVIEIAQGQKNLLNIFARSVPKHTVKVDGFYCDLFEITNAQWTAYLEQTGQEPSTELVDFVWKKQAASPPKELDYPVRCVSFRDAQKYARWCGKRLPSEAEWMRAAAGDDGRIYAWGSDWNRGKNCTNKRNTISPVGSYEEGRSAFGMYDMTGSVWEWTCTKSEQYKKYKSPEMKIGKKKVKAEPAFNASDYIVKGGHYLAGHNGNRLDVRDPSNPVNRLDSLGFRCIKDLDPGMTLYQYAREDLEGSSITDYDCNAKDMYAMEVTHLSDGEPRLITGFDGMLLCPVAKANTTTAKIIKDSPETPQPIGIFYVNHALEEPNLPPGSYVLAYRQSGMTAKEKQDQLAREAKERELKEEEEKKKAEEKAAKEGKGEPKTQEEIAAEKEEARRREEEKQYQEEKRRRDEEAKQQLERIGAVSSAKEHVPFPRNKNLILFMNANDTVVGYVVVEKIIEDSGAVPTRVVHSPASGMTDIEMGMRVLPSKTARFKLAIKVRDNPF